MIGAPFNGLRRAWRELRAEQELADRQRRAAEMAAWLDPAGAAEQRRAAERQDHQRLSRADAAKLVPPVR